MLIRPARRSRSANSASGVTTNSSGAGCVGSRPFGTGSARGCAAADGGGGRGEGGAAGIGLANTRARLGHLYGEAHSLSLTREEAGGARAEVAIPYRTAGSAPAREGGGRLAS